MASYVTLYRFTDQGLRNIRDTVTRARAGIAAIGKAGGKGTIYWTQGRYDMVGVFEAPADEDAANAILFSTLQAGNVRTETMRALTAEEMERALKKIP